MSWHNLGGMHRHGERPRRLSPARGFALALVLWVIAGLSVIAAAANQNASLVAISTKAFGDRARAEQAFTQARAELLFTLSSSGVTQQGRRVGSKNLRVDDSPYRTGDGAFMSIQDSRGLLNLNDLNNRDGVALMRACGAPNAEAAQKLVDALSDYVDADDLKRLNGAESADYAGAQLPGPTNHPLLALTELWRVFGWVQIRDSWGALGCDNWVMASNELGFNYASAPAAVLKIKGFEPAVATALVTEREASNGQVSALANNIASFSLSSNPFGGGMMARPGGTYRVRHWHESGASLQYVVVLPSVRGEPPWIILDPTWSWGAPFALRRTDRPFPLRTPEDLTEDALSPRTSTPF